MKRLLLFCILSMSLLPACAWFDSKPERSAQELVDDGIAEFNSGDYRNALEAFETLKDWYPFSKYAILAELKIADAYFHLEEYAEAEVAYEEFANLHPRNDAIPYVMYQIGRCSFDQIDTVDRDQTTARRALDAFTRLIRRFPASEYADKAGEHVKACTRSLAGHEFYVGMFYFRGKHYKAALHRFNAVVSNYPDVGMHKEALSYIARCKTYLAQQPPDS